MRSMTYSINDGDDDDDGFQHVVCACVCVACMDGCKLQTLGRKEIHKVAIGCGHETADGSCPPLLWSIM